MFLDDKIHFYVLAGLHVFYLDFVDNIMVFSKASQECLLAIKEFVYRY
mgnify:CR=1 FL=1